MDCRRLALTALAYLFVALQAQAQLAELVVELDQGFLPFLASTEMGGFEEARGLDRLFFTARTAATGWEVWTTDGTGSGTRILGDFCPGSCGGHEAPKLFSIDDRILWLSPLGDGFSENGFALLSSDGAPDGLHVLLGPDEASLEVAEGAVFDGIYIFPNRDGLWRSDGTPQGTSVLHPALSGAREFTQVGEALFFLADTELWATDSTAGGTRRVNFLEDLLQPRQLRFNGENLFLTVGAPGVPGLYISPPDGSDFRRLTTLPGALEHHQGFPVVRGRQVYVTIFQGTTGEELWQTDGTAGGTRRITDFPNPRPFQSLTSERLQVAGGRAVFVAQEDPSLPRFTVWTGDGTPAGFQRLAEAPLSEGSRLHSVGSRVVFPVVGSGCPQRIFSTNGTAAGTRPLQGALEGGCASNLAVAERIGEHLYFLAWHPEAEQRLWKTDGTPGGTRAVTEGGRGPRIQEPLGRWIAPTPKGLVFSQRNFDGGYEPWIADSGAASPRPLIDLDPQRVDTGTAHHLSLGGRSVFSIPSRVRFTPPFDEGVPATVWATDGTAEGTAFVAHQDEGAGEPSLRARALGQAFLTLEGQLEEPTHLLVSDGTRAGTRQIATFEGPDPSLEAGPVDLGSLAYFWARDEGRLELWQTDGTAGGTRVTLPLEGEHTGTETPVALGGLLYFETEEHSDLAERSRLWASDGSTGTRLLHDFGFQGDEIELHGFVEVHGSILFVVSFLPSGPVLFPSRSFQIWRTDGTATGTEPVSENLFFGAVFTADLVTYHGEAYFVAEGLWKTDGTAEGTVLVAPATLSPNRTCEREVAIFENRLYLPLFDPAQGCELFVSDGTEDGTVPLADLHRGPSGSNPQALLEAGGSLFFTANDGIHGRELWRLDPGATLPRLAHDIFPGGESSLPGLLATVGDSLLFFADDGLRGRELWRLSLAAGASPCRAGETALCLEEGRFRVEAEWKNFLSRRGSGHARPLTEDTGTFWFFDEENLEVMIKILDGEGINGHFWTFFGALSNVEYWLTVTDSSTGAARRYYNPSRAFASLGDTFSFGPRGASLTSAPGALAAPPASEPVAIRSHQAAATAEGCTPSPNRLCLNGGRFAVEATFADFQGNGGTATNVPLTDDTGALWFFREANLELMVKVLDGQAVNGNYWVFFGSLSNVDFDLEVTDTATGRIKTYQNRNRRFASVGDTQAFEGP